jgi:hypothetical protein
VRRTICRGLAASGWPTAAVTMRRLVESDVKPAGGIVGAGFDEFRWPRPVRPGDELRIESENAGGADDDAEPARRARPGRPRHARGTTIPNGSVHAVMGVPGWSAYAATKAGLRAMTRDLASEFAPRGVRVNQVTPGGTRTPIWSPFAPTDQAMAALEKGISRAVPLGRLGEADEVAKAVLFLASEDASNVTGAEIVVDGGATGAPAGAPIYQK